MKISEHDLLPLYKFINIMNTTLYDILDVTLGQIWVLNCQYLKKRT
jgi:hypothetical protein